MASFESGERSLRTTWTYRAPVGHHTQRSAPVSAYPTKTIATANVTIATSKAMFKFRMVFSLRPVSQWRETTSCVPIQECL